MVRCTVETITIRYIHGHKFVEQYEFEIYYENLPNYIYKIIEKNLWFSEGDLIKIKKVAREPTDREMDDLSYYPEYKTYILTPSGDWYEI